MRSAPRTAALAATLWVAGCASAPQTLFGEAKDGETTLVRAGAAAESAGDYGLASHAYAAASKRDPEATGPRIALARSLLRQNRTVEAVTAFEAVLGMDPGNAEAKLGLGQTLLVRGDYAAAVRAFADPALADDRRALLGSGIALDGLKRHGEAQQKYRAVLAADPMDAAARNNLGLSLALSGDHRDAIELLASMVTGGTASPRTRQNLALAYALSGDEANARRVALVDLPEEQVEANLAALKTLNARR